ncbi:uncharacterized, partial [Tachysurus ichikawai]
FSALPDHRTRTERRAGLKRLFPGLPAVSAPAGLPASLRTRFAFDSAHKTHHSTPFSRFGSRRNAEICFKSAVCGQLEEKEPLCFAPFFSFLPSIREKIEDEARGVNTGNQTRKKSKQNQAK